jgi:hypothetical protein
MKNILEELTARELSLQVSLSGLLVYPKPDSETAKLIREHRGELMAMLQGRQVAAGYAEAEVVRVVVALADVAEKNPPMRPEISKAIDRLAEIEETATPGVLLKELEEIERKILCRTLAR